MKSLSLKARITALVLLLFASSFWLLTFGIEKSLEQDMVAVLEAQQLANVSYIAADIETKLQQRVDHAP